MKFRKLRGRIREMYGSESRFADYIGCSRQVLNKKLNGLTKMTLEDIEVFCQALCIPANEIPLYFFDHYVNFRDTLEAIA